MVDFELESKYSILKNPKAIEESLITWVADAGFKLIDSKSINQVDVYMDKDLQIYKSGFSVRQRFVNGLPGLITLKTLERLDEKGLVRIEEQAKTFPDLAKMVTKKAKSIYQNPVDEKVIGLIENHIQLSPAVIILNSRTRYIVDNGKSKCELSFDTATSLYPVVSGQIRELEIEGSQDFDNIRMYVYEKFGHGRWKAVEKSATSKFEFGLKAGGLI